MAQEIPRPISGALPKAPQEYDERQVNLIIREIEDRFTLLEGFRYLKGSGMLLVTLQGGGNGLQINEVYQQDGFLRIVRPGDVFAPSFLVRTAVGSVTVAIT